ncbi:MAG: hypothetical protein H7308_07015 [Chthonomonadaceae bacterium]|nr:hypothetical protein [Chthonomonadaceae bacterium]
MGNFLFDTSEPIQSAPPNSSSSRRDFLRHLVVAGASVASVPLLETQGQAKPSPFPHLVRARVPFPHDKDLSIYVGVSSKWRGRGFSTHPLTPPFKPQPIKNGELKTDFAAFPLTEKPTLKEFDRLLLTRMPLLNDPDWYAFEAEYDEYHLIFDVRDTQKRLGRVVVTDLESGKVLGLRHSNREHTVVRGKLLFPWARTYCLLSGYDLDGEVLFRGIASNGQPDTWVYFTQVQQFAAYRPPTVPPAPLKESDQVSGPEGDPYNLKGLDMPGQPVALYSIGSGWHEQTNDTGVSNPLVAPDNLQLYQKTNVLDSFLYLLYRHHDRLGMPLLPPQFGAPPSLGLQPAFANLLMPPYSHNVGQWLGKYFVRTTAFLVVPYSVARNEGLYSRIRTAFDQFSRETRGISDKFVESLVSTFHVWLESEAGKQSGLKQGMVRSAEDVKMLYIEEISKRLIVSHPLYVEVSFAIEVPFSPPPGPISGRGSVEIISVAPGVPDSPPPPSTRYYTLDFVNGRAKLRLPKGWYCLAKVAITDLPGYSLSQNELKFDSFSGSPIRFLAMLSHCLTLKIETDLAADIVIQTKDGLSLYSGATHYNGKTNVFVALTVPPDTYSIFATERNRRKKPTFLKKGKIMIIVSVIQEETFSLILTDQQENKG